MGPTHVVDSHTAPLRRDERTGDRSADQRVIEYEFTSFEDFIEYKLQSHSVKPSFPLAEILFAKLFTEFTSRDYEDGSPNPKRARRSHSPLKSEKWSDFISQKIESLGGKITDSLIADLKQKMEDLHLPSLPHFAAIHGALVSQEIMKYITKRDIPLVNQIVLNPRDCGALVVKTPVTLSSRIIDSGSNENEEVQVVAAVEGLD